MKKLLVISILCSVMVMAGCSMSKGPTDSIAMKWASQAKDRFTMLDRPTLVDSAEERDFRIAQIDDFHRRMFIDDWDRLWLRHRNSDLTYWTARVGH